MDVKKILVIILFLFFIWLLYEKSSINEKWKLILCYTLEFFAIAFLLLKCFGNFSLINKADGFEQCYPTFVYCGKYIREVIKGILHGQFVLPQFDFSIGLGEGILPSLNYYGFGDPFMLISALVPVKYSAYAFSVFLLLKVYVSGLSFIFFCKKRNCKSGNILLGTPIYIAGNYLFYFTFLFPPFLNTAISLPLVCAGIDEIVNRKQENKRKTALVLILAVAFQALSGFYMLYMELLFAAIYAMVCILCRTRKVKEIVKQIGILFVHVLAGITLSGIVFFPALAGYFGSSRSGEFVLLDWRTLLQLDKKEYWELFASFIVPVGLSAMGIFLPFVAIVLLFVGVKRSIKNKDLKIILLLTVIAYLFTRAVSWVAGGFTNNVYYNRWTFSLVFALSFGIVTGVEHLENISKKTWSAFAVISIIYILTAMVIGKSFFADGLEEQRVKVYIIYAVIIAVETILIILINGSNMYRAKGTYYILLGCILVGVGFNIYSIFDASEGYGACWNFKMYESVRDEILGSDAQLYSTEGEFARIDIDGNNLNEGLYCGYYGATEHLSMMNGNILEFYKNYAIVSEMNGMLYKLTGLEGRSCLEDLLSAEYYNDVKQDVIVENTDKLPIAFTYDEYISENNAKAYNAMEKNAIVLAKLILNEVPEGMTEGSVEDIEKYMQEEPCVIEYQNIERNGNSLKVNENSKIILNVDSDTEGECYFYTDTFQLTKSANHFGHFSVQDIRCSYRNDVTSNQIWTGLFCLGNISKGRSVFEISFEEEAEYAVDEIKIYVIRKEIIEELNAKRQREVLQKIKVENDSVSGEISVDGKKMLFLGVPYSDGWEAYINGKKTPVYRADYGFMAIALEAGENDIYIKYTTPGMKVGVCCTIISLIAIIGYYIIINRQRKNEEKGF